ncbi:MAG: hypothetical protein AAB354_16600 [candidate division KSB1 bacterium]
MKRFIVSLALLLGLIILADYAHAGAWTQKRGHGFYKLEGRFIYAQRFFEPDGKLIDIPTLSDYTASFYGEYGLNQRLTLVAYVPFYKRLALNRQIGEPSGFVYFAGDSTSGFADTDVGFRFGLKTNGPTVLSARVMFGVPLGKDEQQSGLLTGDGEFNQLFALELGHSFYPLPLYFSGEAGFNNRTKGFSDELRYTAELGYTFWNNVTLMMKFLGVASLKNGEDNIRSGMGGLYGNNVSYLALGPSLFYQINKKFGVTAGVDGATYGQNVLAAPSYSLGIYFKQ